MKWLQHIFSVCLKVSGHVLYRIWPQRQTGSSRRKHGVIEKEDAESNILEATLQGAASLVVVCSYMVLLSQAHEAIVIM